MRKPMNIDFERCNSGIEFEEWIKELLGQLRMKAERVVKNDCGIDIIAIAIYCSDNNMVLLDRKKFEKCVRFEFKSCVYR